MRVVCWFGVFPIILVTHLSRENLFLFVCGRVTGYSSLIGLGKSCRPNVPYARLGRECRTPTRTARRIADP